MLTTHFVYIFAASFSSIIIFNTEYDFLGEDFRNWGADEIVSKSSGPAMLVHAVMQIISLDFERRQANFAQALPPI